MASTGERWRYFRLADSPTTKAPPADWPRLDGLPDGYVIEDFTRFFYFDENDVVIRVSHPSFPPLPLDVEPVVERIGFVGTT